MKARHLRLVLVVGLVVLAGQGSPVVAQRSPNLVVESVTFNPAAPEFGQLVNVTVTVRSDFGFTGPFKIDWYAHRLTAPGPGLIGTFRCAKSGFLLDQTTCAGTVTYGGAGQQTVTTWAQVDTDRQVTETNETDNVHGPHALVVYPTFYQLSNSGPIAVLPGSSGETTITAWATQGRPVSPVTFSVSGLPVGATATFASPTCTPTCTTTMTVSTTAATPTGDYLLKVTGTTRSVSTNVNLKVVSSSDYLLTNSGDLTIIRGSSRSNDITATLSAGTGVSVAFAASGLPSGATASFASPFCTTTCTMQLTVATDATTPLGTFPITVTGTPLGKATTFVLNVVDGLPFSVITVPADPQHPNAQSNAVPHLAYAGHAITLKAIVRGLPDLATAATARFRWDTNVDGNFDDEIEEVPRQCVAGTPDGVTCYDLSARVVASAHSVDKHLKFRVRLEVPGWDPIIATYPVFFRADVPAQGDPDDNATAIPQNATDEQLAVMRAVAADDALWYLHLGMTNRIGVGANLSGSLSPKSTLYGEPRSMLIRTMAARGHKAAYPPGTYDHDVNPGVWFRPPMSADFATLNDQRYVGDPYAETAMRAVNSLIAELGSIAVNNVLDEADDGTTPVPDTNDLTGLVSSLVVTQRMPRAGEHLAGLAESGLAGTVAQVGNLPAVRGRSIEYIVQQMVDYVIFAQLDEPFLSHMGGWSYTPTGTQHILGDGIDRAAYGGLHAAKAMASSGVYVNNRARSRMANALKWAQIPVATGASLSYDKPHDRATYHCPAFAETGDALLGAGSLGWSTFDPSDPTVHAVDYAGNEITNGAARGIFDAYLAGLGTTWTTFQNDACVPLTSGLFFNPGLTDPTPYLRTDRRGNINAIFAVANGLQQSPNTSEFALLNGHDWQRDFSVFLVRNQFTDGHWLDADWYGSQSLVPHPGVNYIGPTVTTAYGALILARMPAPTTPPPIDETGPTGVVAINNGAAWTKSAAVMLTLTCVDTGLGCAQVEFSHDGVLFTAPEALSATKSWTLATGDGSKTVFVRYRDGAGNTSPVLSDTITLDTTKPLITVMGDGPDPFDHHLGQRNTISFSLADAQSATCYAIALFVNSSGAVVRNVVKGALCPATGTSNTIAWDGKNNAGALVAPGTYFYVVVGADQAGNYGVSGLGAVTVR